MDQILKCNHLRCRAALGNQGVVTTCSHIFCVDWWVLTMASTFRCKLTGVRSANQLFTADKTCPACETTLGEPDDVVLTNLNPTDDYKTSVLAGLSPNIIVEICSRALSFWTYQATQEIVYQEFMSKTLQEKHGALNAQMDSVVRDANSEITALQEKLEATKQEQTNEKRRNHELIESLQDKSRQFSKLQLLYDKLKRKALLSPMQNAATQNIDAAAYQNIPAHASPPAGKNSFPGPRAFAPDNRQEQQQPQYWSQDGPVQVAQTPRPHHNVGNPRNVGRTPLAAMHGNAPYGGRPRGGSGGNGGAVIKPMGATPMGGRANPGLMRPSHTRTGGGGGWGG
ncbi:hypothetical protein YB2330_001116 [Saitoella coloradoensis]